MSPFVINLLSFQITWWACVAGAAWGLFWVGPVAALLSFVVHMRFVAVDQREWWFVPLITLIGYGADSMLALAGVVQYPGGNGWLGMSPLWILGIWVVFATALNHSLAWFQQHLLLAALFGAISAPLAHRGAAGMGAMALPEETRWLAYGWIGGQWAVGFPLLLMITRKVLRMKEETHAE